MHSCALNVVNINILCVELKWLFVEDGGGGGTCDTRLQNCLGRREICCFFVVVKTGAQRGSFFFYLKIKPISGAQLDGVCVVTRACLIYFRMKSIRVVFPVRFCIFMQQHHNLHAVCLVYFVFARDCDFGFFLENIIFCRRSRCHSF